MDGFARSSGALSWGSPQVSGESHELAWRFGVFQYIGRSAWLGRTRHGVMGGGASSLSLLGFMDLLWLNPDACLADRGSKE